MKTMIIALAITFAAAGMTSSEAMARTRNQNNANARNHSQPARTVRQPARTVRQPARTVRQPARAVRKPVRTVHQPARHVRKPVRIVRTPVRIVRTPVRIVRTPVRIVRTPVRVYRPVLVPMVKTITLSNGSGYTTRLEVRAGNSPICAANPLHADQFVAAGGSISVATGGSFVCYRRVPSEFTAGSGWFRSVASAPFMSLWF